METLTPTPVNPMPRDIVVGGTTYTITSVYPEAFTFDNPLGDKACTAIFTAPQDLGVVVTEAAYATAIEGTL